MTRIAIVYYSLYGHIATLAESIQKGIEAGGATCDVYQVAETLPEEVLAKMGAPPKRDHPIMTADKLPEYDGIIFGLSGRFGTMPAQIKVSPITITSDNRVNVCECEHLTVFVYGYILTTIPCSLLQFIIALQALFDSCGQLWAKGSLVGKTAATFCSTASMGGGQETVSLSVIPFFVHHGMVYVPMGYTHPKMTSLDEIHGGSPYGAGTLAAADGSRMPSDLEKEIAEHQGKHFAGITAKLAADASLTV
jgi:NAD(P)H dehydrogenase (quinone)